MSDQVSGQFSVDSSQENGTQFTNDRQSTVSVTFTASGTWNTGSSVDYGPEGKVGTRNKNAAYPNSTLYALLAVNSNNEVVGEGANISLSLQADEGVRFVVNDTHYPNNSGQLTVDWQINATATRQLPAADETNDEPEQAGAPSKTTPVANPTWYADIRHMFTRKDFLHMMPLGVNLRSYNYVSSNAGMIYQQVAAGNMPPDEPWPPAWVTTFSNWMTNEPACLKGTPALSQSAAAVSNASRIRKDITTLSPTELDDLKKAFSGIMAKDSDPDDPNSYFVQASNHGRPRPTFCQHHIPGYNPWHRAYLLSFENALRSVPGCQHVTLPYWDITKPFPDVLKEPPFDSYTLPQDIGGGFNAGYVTTRFPYDEIQQELLAKDVTGDINRALAKTDWTDFHGWWEDAMRNTIIAAHDSGHVSIGETMTSPGVAAFDPVFWFFHANWDRLFWEWQQGMQATTLDGLLSTIDRERDPISWEIFTVEELQDLPPFTSNPPEVNTVSIVDSENSLDVGYQHPETSTTMNFLANTKRTVAASENFFVQTDRVNVRVQGLNRLKIPGSFSVHLLKDGKRIASKGMFQPSQVEECENCVNNAIAHFDFELPLADVSNGKLGVEVEPVDKSFVGRRFPHKLMGNPTIEVRLLMTTE